MLEERATFLAEPSWLEDPWKQIPKTNNSAVLDIITLIPVMLGLTRAIQDAVELDGECEDLLDDFDALSMRMRAMHRGASAMVRQVYETGFSSNVHEFTAVQLHACCELLHYDAIQRLSRHAKSSPLLFAKYVDEAAGSKLQMELAAKAIILHIINLNTEDCGFITANLLFLPMLAAARFLKRNASEDGELMASCQQMINTLINRGFISCRLMLDFSSHCKDY